MFQYRDVKFWEVDEWEEMENKKPKIVYILRVEKDGSNVCIKR